MSLREEFDLAMADIYRRARREIGYNATRYIQMLGEYGGYGTAQRLLESGEIQYGFTELWQHGRLDLTVEALVLNPRYEELFSEEQRERARSRLKAHNYDPDSSR